MTLFFLPLIYLLFTTLCSYYYICVQYYTSMYTIITSLHLCTLLLHLCTIVLSIRWPIHIGLPSYICISNKSLGRLMTNNTHPQKLHLVLKVKLWELLLNGVITHKAPRLLQSQGGYAIGLRLLCYLSVHF